MSGPPLAERDDFGRPDGVMAPPGCSHPLLTAEAYRVVLRAVSTNTGLNIEDIRSTDISVRRITIDESAKPLLTGREAVLPEHYVCYNDTDDPGFPMPNIRISAEGGELMTHFSNSETGREYVSYRLVFSTINPNRYVLRDTRSSAVIQSFEATEGRCKGAILLIVDEDYEDIQEVKLPSVYLRSDASPDQQPAQKAEVRAGFVPSPEVRTRLAVFFIKAQNRTAEFQDYEEDVIDIIDPGKMSVVSMTVDEKTAENLVANGLTFPSVLFYDARSDRTRPLPNTDITASFEKNEFSSGLVIKTPMINQYGKRINFFMTKDGNVFVALLDRNGHLERILNLVADCRSAMYREHGLEPALIATIYNDHARAGFVELPMNWHGRGTTVEVVPQAIAPAKAAPRETILFQPTVQPPAVQEKVRTQASQPRTLRQRLIDQGVIKPG